MTERTHAKLFPDALVRWAGHHEGGVRRPFQNDSGRPTGHQIATPLTKRLDRWVKDLVNGESVPRTILLVGGPGNGKTDAVEGCIDRLDEALNSGGTLRRYFEEQFTPREGAFSPRKVVVDLTATHQTTPQHLRCTLSMVQDATEGEPSENASAEQLLLRELAIAASGRQLGIYICCVNRGILAAASAIAHDDPEYDQAAQLISQITKAVTNRPDSPPCWPLEHYEHIAIWPMDMESLVAPPSDGSQSVAHQILESVVDATRWKEPCALKTRCPFCRNRSLLARKGAVDSLVSLLYYYELSSSKRWTFRDLFSLISYVLVGDASELAIKGRIFSPCEWAAEQLRLHEQGTANSPERDRAIYLLTSRLYFHRLFPRWPSLDAGEYRTAKQELLRDGQVDPGLAAAKAFFRYMAKTQELAALATGDVPSLIRKSFGAAIEPAVASGSHVLFLRDNVEVTVDDVENHFSLSVSDGLSLCGSQIETLEKNLLESLSRADASLADDGFTGIRTRQARLLRAAIRQFSTRLVKRSLCSRKGVCRDLEHYTAYVSALTKPTELNEVRKQLRNLLHDRHNKFRAPLATTFGQPVAERSRDVSLILPRMISVQTVRRNASDRRPPDPTPFFLAEHHAFAITFDLFRALRDVANGMHAASLPTDIYSLLDRIKSLVAGDVARDPDLLDSEPRIVLGASGDAVDFVNGGFHYSNGDA